MHGQRGNILFLILLAVVLFAALSYAVTRGERGQVKNASSEKSSTIASNIVQTGGLLENTVNRLRLTNSCKENQLSFDNPTVSGYTNSAAPADKSCHVFDPAGGGVSWPTPPQDSGATVYYIGTPMVTGAGTGGADLTLFADGLTREVCDEINQKVDSFVYKNSYALTEDSFVTLDNPRKFTGPMCKTPI